MVMKELPHISDMAKYFGSPIQDFFFILHVNSVFQDIITPNANTAPIEEP